MRACPDSGLCSGPQATNSMPTNVSMFSFECILSAKVAWWGSYTVLSVKFDRGVIETGACEVGMFVPSLLGFFSKKLQISWSLRTDRLVTHLAAMASSVEMWCEFGISRTRARICSCTSQSVEVN